MKTLRLPLAGRLSPAWDPWDPWPVRKAEGRHLLTSIEFTVTHRCNMRCAHCAVGDALTESDRTPLPLDLLIRRLEEVEHLKTVSITGGEPSFAGPVVESHMLPLLRWSRTNRIASQMNSNLTMPYGKYEPFLDLLDVMHITYNYEHAEDFYDVGFAKSDHLISREGAYRLFDQLCENARRLSDQGMFVSAESMINYRTHDRIERIHRQIVELGCVRHEVHPMYPTDFAVDLPKLSIAQTRASIHRLLDARDRNLWMLFGTLPVFACSADAEDRRLVQRLLNEPQVTVRNDPDGRNRLNVDLFTGNIYVTDFAAVPPLGNILTDRFEDVFARWQNHPLQQVIDCACIGAECCGPNLIVRDMYYPDTDFRTRNADPAIGREAGK